MIIDYLKNLLPFFKKSERFLIVEILDYFLRVSYVKANFDKKEIFLVKTLKRENSLADLNKTFTQLKKFLSKFGNLLSYSLILNLDSSISTTIHSAVSLIRSHPREPIDEADLDNLISQAIWKMFDRYRAKVAFKMAVNDLDVLLTDIQIKRVKLDGHKVVNPLGFQARSVEIELSQTFVARHFINNLKLFLPKERVVLINEAGASWASVMRQNSDAPDFLFVNLFPHETSIFLARGPSLSYLDIINWGEKDLRNSLAQNLAVNEEVAQKILNRHVLNDVSESFSARISKILDSEFQILAKGIETQLKRLDIEAIYFLPFFMLPQTAFSGKFKNRLHHTIKLLGAGNDLFRDKFGFKVKLNRLFDEKSRFPILSGLLQLYFLPADDKIRKMATRRIRWLAD